MKKISKWKRWWYTTPDQNDYFGVHVRELFQNLFRCPHDWVEHEYKRKCSMCGTRSIMVWNRFAAEQTVEWRDYKPCSLP